ncbi:DUF1183-domain-containing protein [Violaceomyces palustris]|uniref:DUF1183-domain-containing protein n=1 Tax=Violaceomyces palustris TaxID=1673888 RepID=A0ACD0NY39_9BASI|nr:DUF1183-domain-containing protein [Violaceomyces palustris]
MLGRRRPLSSPLLRLVLFLSSLLLLLASTARSQAYRGPHYGANRRILKSSIKALTFYQGKQTAYRRTSPLAQLTCLGKPCSRYQPDVVQCVSVGDDQWKCTADLPPSIRMGRVEVSCEGWDHADDDYILKDSCALEYTLLPSYGPDEDSRGHYHWRTDNFLDPIVQAIFWIIKDAGGKGRFALGR